MKNKCNESDRPSTSGTEEHIPKGDALIREADESHWRQTGVHQLWVWGKKTVHDDLSYHKMCACWERKQKAMQKRLCEQQKSFFSQRMKGLVERYENCLAVKGD